MAMPSLHRWMPTSLALFCTLLLNLCILSAQDSTVNFWSGVTPKQNVASKAETEQTLQVIRSIATPDTSDFTCPAFTTIGHKIDGAVLATWLQKTYQLQLAGRVGCVMEICDSLLAHVGASDHEVRARLLAEKVFAAARFRDTSSILIPAEALRRLYDQHEVAAPAPLLALAVYYHVKKNASEHALSLAQSALEAAKSGKDRYWQMRSLSVIGMISRDVFFGSSLRAVPYHEQALKIATEIRDTAGIVSELIGLGFNYDDAGEQSRHLDYLRQAAGYLQHFRDVRRTLSLWIGIAGQLDADDRKQDTEQLFWQGLRVTQKLHLSELARDINTRMFEFYMGLNNLPAAEAALLRAADQHNDGSHLAESFYQLAKAKNQPEKALFYLEKAYATVSANYLDRNAVALSRMETQYGTKEKERLLAANSRQKSLLLVFSALTTFLLALAYWAYRRTNKTKKALAEQKTIVEAQAAELREIDELKSRFFANVSHELRTPLTLILGPVGTLLNTGELSAKGQKLLTMAQDNANGLLKLVSSILDLSKLEAEKLEIRENDCALFPFTRRLASNFESHAQRLGLYFVFDYKAQHSLQVLLDAERVETIVNNLLSNAMKFTPKGGTVTMTVSETSHRVNVAISDTGRGIYPGDLPHIFDRFYQSQAPGAATEGGTGIGLTLSLELAQLMGGDLQVNSQWQQGSTFLLELPRKASEGVGQANFDFLATQQGSGTAQETTLNTAFGDKGFLLIVEDHYSLREYLEGILSEHYHIQSVANGAEALDILPECMEHPMWKSKGGLILSDIMMPVMDGFQLLDHLKTDARYMQIPVIILTARADIKDKLHALRTGVDDYLLKPFIEAELLARAANLLTNYRRRVFSPEEIAETESLVLEQETTMMSPVNLQWLENLEAKVRPFVTNDTLNVEWIAAQVFMSERQLYRRLKALTGLTVHEYIREMRLQEARYLLENRLVDSVKKAAHTVCFQDVKYFTQIFKARFGKNPSEI